ncbi:MAG: hypothetical protein ACK5JO_15975, partial [Halodesulfovibrio sp.]
MKRLIPWYTSFMQFSLGPFLNIVFGALTLLLACAMLLVWSAEHHRTGLDDARLAPQIERLRCAALLDFVVLSGDTLVATPDRKERLIHLKLVNRYIGEFNGVHLLAAGKLLEEAGR